MIWSRSPSSMVHLVRQYTRKLFTCRKLCETKPSSLNKGSPIDAIPSPPAKDIIIYRFEKPKFYRNLSIFALGQYGFWMVISYSSTEMVDIPVSEMPQEEKDKLPWWKAKNLGSDKYKYGLGLGSFLMGFGILTCSWMYILRTVRYLVLRKDGATITFVTYTPTGRNRMIDVPIRHISAAGSRSSGSTQIPVKIKGRSLYFLVDLVDGEFLRPQIFDKTVGMKRVLK